jgi:hypothetical protein
MGAAGDDDDDIDDDDDAARKKPLVLFTPLSDVLGLLPALLLPSPLLLFSFSSLLTLR